MHPYENLEGKYFWATAVAKRSMFEITDMWDPKFQIRQQDKVVTFGSCFAQHIGQALAARGFNWLITESAPRGLSPENAMKFNYGAFSARTGNIYTASLLQQWVNWALGDTIAPHEAWEKDGLFFDPFRPNIEPGGFQSIDEMLASRDMAIEAFKAALTQSSVFVFTLGLTESWFNSQLGYEYPMCPGTVAGNFDQDKHQFLNQDFPFIRHTLTDTIKRIRKANPRIKVLLTVSPVPLTATMSGNHILVATTESKSVLRSVAGTLQRQLDFVDYFPSYEIITAPPFRAAFFESNQRSVCRFGVDHVMNSFFACQNVKFGNAEAKEVVEDGANQKELSAKKIQSRKPVARSRKDIVCEEELLNAFAR